MQLDGPFVAGTTGRMVMAGQQPLATRSSLEERGLITRTADPDDWCVRRLGITPHGTALARQAIAAVEATDATFFGPVGDPEPLLEILTRLA